MDFKYLAIVSLMMAALVVSGCTTSSPSATATPTTTAVPTSTPLPTPLPTAIVNASTPTPEPSATATPTPTPTPTPTATPAATVPMSISNVKIQWDTTQYDGLAKETATMTVKNTLSDDMVLDAKVLYKVTTPTTFIDPDGTVHNLTNTITRTANIGMLEAGASKDLTFNVDFTKNVPSTVVIVVQWRGGEARVFEETMTFPDHNFGVYNY